MYTIASYFLSLAFSFISFTTSVQSIPTNGQPGPAWPLINWNTTHPVNGTGDIAPPTHGAVHDPSRGGPVAADSPDNSNAGPHFGDITITIGQPEHLSTGHSIDVHAGLPVLDAHHSNDDRSRPSIETQSGSSTSKGHTSTSPLTTGNEQTATSSPTAGDSTAIFANTTASSTTSVPSTASATTCPAIWTTIASDLQQLFAGCNPNARFAIRFAFHDAGGYSSKTASYGSAAGGADGSILLNDTEIARGENNPMQGFRNLLLQKLSQYRRDGAVSGADLVQFAGSVAIRSCSGGPVVKTLIGRFDDSTACPENMLPAAFGQDADYTTLVALFSDKGLDLVDLAALMGAHTVSQSFAQRANGIPVGAPQDSTPTKWDNKYYQQFDASTPSGVYHFESDANLAQANTTVGAQFARFAVNPDAWNSAFTSAMARMSLLGINSSVSNNFVDCTHLISGIL